MQWQQTGDKAQTHLTVLARRQPSVSTQARQQAEADLQLTAQVERSVVQRGSQYAYSLTINNLGPATVTGVKLTSQLPIGMSYIVANPTQGSCFNSNGAITCNLGSLPVNLPASILIGVTITDRAALGGVLTYAASVAGEQRDPQLDNNQISVATFVSGKATIAGRLTDAQGKALANVTVNVSGSAVSARVTDAQGNFLFDELASGGDYTVTPASALLWFDPPSRSFPEFKLDQTANFVANACQYSAGPTVHNLPSGGGNASVTVTTTARCPWTASSQTPWITLPAGSNGVGNGQLNFNVSSTNAPRTGRLTVAGQEIAVYQVAGSCPVPAYRSQTLLTQGVTPDSQPFAADFNGDGLSELLVMQPPSAGARPLALYSLEENGNGWRLWSELRAPLGALTPAAADFNGDGKMDLLLVNSSNNANATGQLYLGNGRGGWELPDKLPLSLKPLANLRQIYTNDLNDDGRPDVVVDGGGNLAFITLSQAGNRYAAPSEMNLGNDSLLAIADFTGDGDADVLTGSGTQLRLQIGGLPGAGRLPVVTPLNAPLTIYGVKDFTGDSRADLLVGQERLADGNLAIMTVNGSGRFEAPNALSIGPLGGQTLGNGSYQFIAEDFNGDARIDVMLMINAATRLFLAGDGGGRLSPPIVIELPFESRSFVAGRFTRNNSLDLFALGQGAFANQLQLYASTCGAQMLMIYGRVVEGSSNRGVAGATLKLSGNRTATATTDLGGYYEFDNLPARFAYAVTTENGEFDFSPPRVENNYLTKDALFNFQARRRFAAVNSASYAAALAPDAIITIFGLGLTTATQMATSFPPPETLGSLNVNFTDDSQRVYPAKLFFVSPNQINLLVPGGLAPGACKMTIASAALGRFDISATIKLDNVAPGLFTSDASGRGLPAAVLLRIAANGRQTYESVSRYDAARNQFVAVPIDLSNATDQVYLLLYGTGMRNRAALNGATVVLGGLEVQPLYVGAQGSLLGLDQINVRLPNSLRGRGDINLNVTVDGKTSNTVTLNFK